MKNKIAWIGCLIALSLVIAGSAVAADYPTKTITLINPMPPGGSLDIQARAFAAVADTTAGPAAIAAAFKKFRRFNSSAMGPPIRIYPDHTNGRARS